MNKFFNLECNAYRVLGCLLLSPVIIGLIYLILSLMSVEFLKVLSITTLIMCIVAILIRYGIYFLNKPNVIEHKRKQKMIEDNIFGTRPSGEEVDKNIMKMIKKW